MKERRRWSGRDLNAITAAPQPTGASVRADTTASTAALGSAAWAAQTQPRGDLTTADRRRSATDSSPTEAPPSARRSRISLAAAAAAIICVAGVVAALVLSAPGSHASHKTQQPQLVAVSRIPSTPSSTGSVNVKSPSSGTLTRAEYVAVKGTMAPSNATVQIQGKAVPGGNGAFAGNVPLHTGTNTIDIIASAPGSAPATTTITLTRQGSRGTPNPSKKTEASGNSEPAALMQANAPSGVYSLLVPSNWSPHTETSSSGQTIDVWSGSNQLEKLSVIVSNCSTCATSGGNPDARAVGLPAGTISSFDMNRSALGFEAYTGGNPNPDNGVIVVTSQGAEATGYSQLDLWLPNSLHSTATRILDSFSLLQAATG